MKCKKCGTELSENDKFCKNCGATTGETDFTNQITALQEKINLYAIISALLMFISVFMTYASTPFLGGKLSVALIDGTDGYFFIVMALVTILLSVKNGGISVLISGIISMYMVFVKYDSDFDSITKKEIGFYLLVLGSAGIIVSGLLKLKCKKNVKIIVSVIIAILCLGLFIPNDTKNDNKKNDEIKTTTNDNNDTKDQLIANDITNAKSIKTAVETAMGNESFYDELCDKKNVLIDLTDNGLSTLSDGLAQEIKADLGSSIPTVKYTENGAEHFAFLIDDSANVQVIICSFDNSKKWMIIPMLDQEYGGDYTTPDDIGLSAEDSNENDSTDEISEATTENTTEDTTEDTTEVTTEATTEITTDAIDPAEAKSNDVVGAKSIRSALENALSNENLYDELSESKNKLIDITEGSFDNLSDKFYQSVMSDLGNKIPNLYYNADGATHYSFLVDDSMKVNVFICSADNSKKWMITPNLDVNYGGDYNTATEFSLNDTTTEATTEATTEVTTEATTEAVEQISVHVIQQYQRYVGMTILTANLEYSGDTGYLALLQAGASEPTVYDIYKSGDTWYSTDGTHIITYLSDGNIEIYSETVDLVYAGTFKFVSQQVYPN